MEGFRIRRLRSAVASVIPNSVCKLSDEDEEDEEDDE